MKTREPWNFCETPKEKCTMNYCDDNGCQNRKRNYVNKDSLISYIKDLPYPELEIAILKFKRAIDMSKFGLFLHKTVEWLSKRL